MTDLSSSNLSFSIFSLDNLSLADLPALQNALDKLGLVITLKEPTEAMLKRGWHCIDFDRPGYSDGQTTWDRPPPHQTSMKEDVRDAFVIMNEEAQAEICRQSRLASRKSLSAKRIKRTPLNSQP